jgi:transcriptional regulator with XRE-family HTH domain
MAESANVPNGWLLDLSKKSKIINVNMDYLLNLCNYLGITINQLIEDEDTEEIKEVENLDNTDIGYIIKVIIDKLDKDDPVTMDGQLLNNQAKAICKDSLQVVKSLTRQYL